MVTPWYGASMVLWQPWRKVHVLYEYIAGEGAVASGGTEAGTGSGA